MSPQLNELFRRLDGVRRRLRIVALLSGVVDSAVALLVTVPLILLLDNWRHFSSPARVVGCAVIVGATAAMFGKRLRAVFSRWRYEALALRVEERYPELENRLINAIQLSDAATAQGPLGAAMIQAVTREAVAETKTRNLRRAVETRALKRGLLVALCLAPLAALYPLMMPEQFQNAALRIMMPTRTILPLTRIRLAVEPGDTELRAGQDVTLAATPQLGSPLPRQARVEIESDGARLPFTMTYDGTRFGHQVRGAEAGFSYRVVAEDFESAWHTVRVYDLPRVERLDVRYDYPAYTTLPPATQEGADGNLAALKGTRATITAWTNLPVATAAAELKSGGVRDVKITEAPETAGDKKNTKAKKKKERGSVLSFSVALTKDDAWQWKLADKAERAAEETASHTIKALGDDPPRATIVSPPEAVTVPQGKPLSVLYTAWDDYGVARAELLLERKNPVSSATLADRKLEKPMKTVNEAFTLRTGGFAVGQEFQLVARASDANPEGPGVGRSQALTIKIGPPETADAATSNALGGILTGLTRLLEAQIATRRDLGLWQVALGDAKLTEEKRVAIARELTLRQSTIRADAQALGDTPVPDAAWKKLAATLRALAGKELREATLGLAGLEKLAAPQRKSGAAAVMKLQTAIIEALRKIIEALVAAHPELKEQAEREKKQAEDRPRPSGLKDLHDTLVDYIEEHKGLVSSLQAMENVDPKNFGTSMTQSMDELAKMEEKWDDYFKDCKEWLRESPMVKGTESGLKDELIEMTNEIDKLPEALRHDPVTIKVPEAQTGVELAEKLKEDLEKWLPEEPDYQKWVMENSSKQLDVPLADLPDQLEDMIGDLIESEQEMTDANEDQTSNWADSMSQAGWGAADGPMSNYSAKGVTGNIMPNNTDISGRSGEGRSGRSLGEMVESVATGKGGRDTQTRMTNDAMGASQVQDMSTEQTGGVTGGGKVAGTTGYGLVSASAPVQPEVAQKMAQRQADLRMKAVSLQAALARMRLPGGGMDRSIQGMRQIEQAIQKGRYETLRDLGATVVQDLRDQRRQIGQGLTLRKEGQASGARKVQTKVRQDNPENFPEEYRDLISAYYQALSTEEKK